MGQRQPRVYSQCLCSSRKLVSNEYHCLNGLVYISNCSEHERPCRKRALLLCQAGPEVHEIFKTLPDTGEEKDFNKAAKALTKHIEPGQNRIYQTYMFRQATQQENEIIDEYQMSNLIKTT